MFIQDTTASQQPYIDTSVARCKDICLALQGSGQLDKVEGLQLAVIAFRDHGDEYVTNDFGGFTNNVETVISNLNSLAAHGGGDLPEATTAALDKALKLKWREDAAKIAVLITPTRHLGMFAQTSVWNSSNDVNLSEGKSFIRGEGHVKAQHSTGI